MIIHNRLIKQCQKTKKSTILKRHSKLIYFLFIAILLIGSVSLVSSIGFFNSLTEQSTFAKPQTTLPTALSFQAPASVSSSVSEQTIQSINNKPQFEVNVVYAYVGPRKDHFTASNPLQDKVSVTTLNAKSLYPSIVYLNFTHMSNAEVESYDAKMTIYLIQITSDTGATENYTYAEGTNYNPLFSDLNALSSHIKDFTDVWTTNGLRGGFRFNWTTKTFTLGDRVGSYGSYTSRSSGLGLWSTGEPTVITVSVSRIGWITLNGSSVSTALDAKSETLAQVQLEKFGDGFIYNTIVPQQKLSLIDLYNPPLPPNQD
jgi:hypothetical protein